MSPTAVEDSRASHTRSDQTDSAIPSAEGTTANHALPAPSPTAEENNDQSQTDDAATMAASEELRHTTISDRVNPTAQPEAREALGEDKEMGELVKAHTPEHDELRARISSPKKKRGRDFDDDPRDAGGDEAGQNGSAIDGGAVNPSRTIRSEPEKKRPRDTSEETSKLAMEAAEAKEIEVPPLSEPNTTTTAGDSETSTNSSAAAKPVFGSALTSKPQTSSSAFMSSGFGALSSSATSPFGTIGASKPSVFGGGASAAPSGFGALGGAKSSDTSAATTGGLGAGAAKPATGFAFGAGAATSGFGGLGSKSVFGSAIGNGFSGGSGPKLSSFAAPTKEDVAPTKPAKAFGAPDSDEDEESDDGESDAAADSAEDDGVKSFDDKKKFKATRAYVEDGESGETTMLQLRARLFALGSKETGWKERGVGTLKINVPESCASFDENGAPIPGSYDISGLDDEDEDESSGPRVPRLIMRQESTHRVILNTIIIRAMEFKDKPSTSAAQVLFTAFEGDKEPKPINMLLKMSEANFKLFRSEIDSIQHELS